MGNCTGTVVVVDDEALTLEMLSVLLRGNGLKVRAFPDAESALAEVMVNPPDLLLTDVYMPRMSGITLLSRFRAFDQETPVILMTAAADLDIALSAVKLKVFDLIQKPFHPVQVAHAVGNAVKANRERLKERRMKAELESVVIDDTWFAGDSSELIEAIRRQNDLSVEVIERLTAAAEHRDQETGGHIARIGSYAALLARTLGMPEQFCSMIAVAATMHDIGKIAVPDSILLKKGPLTAEEFQVMKRHTLIGEEILSGSKHPMLQMAASIALTHHERWDGSGYPFGLTGEEIPLAGRIVMIADQYDALRSRRAYKEPLAHEEACAVITTGDTLTLPRHFDPAILQAFKKSSSRLRDTFEAQPAAQRRYGRGMPSTPSPFSIRT